MYYSCLKCSIGFNANFSPNKTRCCKKCHSPCIPEGKRRHAIAIALKVLREFIKFEGENETWEMIERTIKNPIKRIYFRKLLDHASKIKEKRGK